MFEEKEFNYQEEVIDTFVDRVSTDPFKPGCVITGQYPDDIAEAIEHLMYIQSFKSIEIKVWKDDSNPDFLKFSIINRQQQ